MAHAFVLILLVTLVLTLTVYLFIDPVLRFLQIPQELYAAMRTYLLIMFAGLAATFLYNFSLPACCGRRETPWRPSGFWALRRC